MGERAKRLLVSGLDFALSARGVEDAEVESVRDDTLDWARTRLRAVSRRRGVVGGLGVVVTRPGSAELRPFEVALAGTGELTVEVLASAVSPGTERAQWLRLPNAQPQLPFAPGYSGAGQVLAVGPDVVGFRTGTAVAVPRVRHASVVTVPAAWATPIPAGVRVQDAAVVYLAIIAGYGVRRAGRLTGEPVCIFGAGPIGALAHRLVMLQRPGPVSVVATSRRREAAAMQAGADRFLTSDDGMEGIEAAVVIEATGDPDVVADTVAAARAGGTVVLLGSPRGVARGVPLSDIQRKGLRLVGAHVSALATEARRSSTDPFAELARTFLDAVSAGRLDPSDLVGEPVNPREIELLYRRLGQGDLPAAHLDWSRLPRTERVRRRRLTSPPERRNRVPEVHAPSVVTASPTERPLRFAAIGCGDIGLHNARAIAEAANAELVLSHDAVSALAANAAARFGGDVAGSIEEALDPRHVDAVFLSVPHDLHAPLAARAARAGLHVVVEKPMAVDLPAAEEAAAAASAAGVALSVCFCFRYEPVFEAARQLVAAGALGALRGASVVFHADKPSSYWLGGFSGRALSGWRASRARAGGGVLIMNLVHYIDLIRHITGAEPTWVAATARTDEGAEVEDGVALCVRFGNGAIGSLSGSASTRGAPASRFEVWGDVGTISFEPDPAVYTERAIEGVAAGRWCPLSKEPEENPRRIFIERFAADVLAGRAPEVTAADGLAAQAFVDATYRSIEESEPVRIPARKTVSA